MYIGIDIGGSKINSVLVKKNKVIKQRKVLIKPKSNKKILIAQVFDCLDYLLSNVNKKQVKGIGLGVPGLIDFKNQKILNLPNLTDLKNVYLGKLIQKKFKIKTMLDNDSNCFSLAEAILGAGKSKNIVIGVTLGTGIGGGIIINKKIFHGSIGSAGEFGHIKITELKNSRRCSCKARGCLEAYVSTKGILKTAQELGLRGATPKKISDLAKNGNKKALKVYRISGKYLGIALSDLVNILNPDIIVVGGGISNVGELILRTARITMRQNIFSSKAKNTKILKSKLNKNAGAIGAGLILQYGK